MSLFYFMFCCFLPTRWLEKTCLSSVLAEYKWAYVRKPVVSPLSCEYSVLVSISDIKSFYERPSIFLLLQQEFFENWRYVDHCLHQAALLKDVYFTSVAELWKSSLSQDFHLFQDNEYNTFLFQQETCILQFSVFIYILHIYNILYRYIFIKIQQNSGI